MTGLVSNRKAVAQQDLAVPVCQFVISHLPFAKRWFWERQGVPVPSCSEQLKSMAGVVRVAMKPCWLPLSRESSAVCWEDASHLSYHLPLAFVDVCRYVRLGILMCMPGVPGRDVWSSLRIWLLLPEFEQILPLMEDTINHPVGTKPYQTWGKPQLSTGLQFNDLHFCSSRGNGKYPRAYELWSLLVAIPTINGG